MSQTAAAEVRTGRRWGAAVADLVVVLVFVAIGRNAHDHGLSVTGMASTAWPFVAGAALAWLGIVRRRADAVAPRSGAAVWLSTVAVGMVLRVVAGQGTALSFTIVALIFLGVCFGGWRAAARLVARRR